MGKLTNTSVRVGITAKINMPSSLSRMAKSSILLLLMSSISFIAEARNFDKEDFLTSPCGNNCELTCKGDLNVSVDPNTCMALITPSSVSVDIEPACDTYFSIILFDMHGNELPSSTVDASLIGQTITYELSEPDCNNKCWGTALIEDKIAPTLTAQDFTVSCADLYEQGTVAMLLPIVGDDCQNTLPPVLILQEEEDVECSDPSSGDIIGTIVRTYVAQDSGGNISDPVQQTITLTRVTIGAIEKPDDIIFPFDTLSCSSGYATDEFGNPDPSETGVPKTLQENYGEVSAAFSYIDISIPANLVLTGNDAAVEISLGATFPLYDMIFNSLVVSTNGYITTDVTDTGFDLTNDCPLPSDPSEPLSTTGARIYALHDDLQADLLIDSSAEVFYKYMPVSPVLTPTGMLTGVSIFQWKVDHSDAIVDSDLDFQALLFDNGEITYQYNLIGSEMGSGATVGIQSFAMADNSMPLYGTTISCDEVSSVNAKTSVGLVPPTMGGINLYPFPENVFCNGFSQYNDQIFYSDSCVTKLLRTFTIGEWRCNETNERFVTQFIDVMDVEAPTMLQLPNMVVSTAPFSCAANVLLPEISPDDDCNDEDIIVDIEYEVGSRIENAIGENLVTMPIGVFKVTYFATDKCGNESQMSFTVTVEDSTAPIAICDADELYVSSGTAFFSATALNNGSFDDCGAVTLKIARVDDPNYPSLSIFTDKLEFDCDDIGSTYQVALLVTDTGDNTNICTSDLLIKDKIDGYFTNIPVDITIDCSDVIDTYPFANPIVVDNCNTPDGFTTTIEFIEEINSCGLGIFRRVFTIIGTNITASHVIHIENNSDPLLYSEIDFPDDYIVEDGCIDDVTPGGLGNIGSEFGFPSYSNTSGCIKIGESYQDTIYEKDGVCLKMLRTWKVIDWCAQNSDGTYPTFTDIQLIEIKTAGSLPVFTNESNVEEEADENSEEAEVNVVATATHNCDLTFTYEIDYEDGTSENGNGPDASGIYPIGEHELLFEATDACGNTASHVVIVTVTSPLANRATIQGLIYTENSEEVNAVQIGLTGIDVLYDMTEETGEYAFPEMPTGYDYKVLPYKNDDLRNGVSTLDLVLIQRHILGIGNLENPYRMIAADVNNSNNISAADIVILRKVILGVYDEFPGNNSWRFVDANFDFSNATDPWAGNLPEDYEITELDSDMNIDFIGVKTGDVNGSVIANAQSKTTETRSGNTWMLSINDKEVEAGETVTVEVRSADISKVYGWQYTLETNGLSLIDLEPAKANVTNYNIKIDRNFVHMSYGEANGVDIKTDDVLYTMSLKAIRSGKLSEMINVSNRGLITESYHTDMEINNVEILWDELIVQLVVQPEFSVTQNKPNPWNDRTSVGYYIPTDGNVKLVVKDVTGRVLFSSSTYREAGNHTQAMESKFLESNGVLVYEVHYDNQVISNRMIHIR